MKAPSFDDVMAYGFAAGVIGVVLGLVGLGGYSLYETIRSNGETAYCYVEMWSPGQMAPQYQLHAYRPWRMDRIIGNFGTLDEAAAEAARLNCPMGKR